MQKLVLASCLAVTMALVATPGWAAPVIGPFSFPPPVDTIVGYDSLPTASDAEEQAFVAGLLGMTVEALLATYPYFKDQSGFGSPSLAGYDPGFGWAYALVKVDGPNDFSYLFMDDNGSGTLAGGDDLLTTPAAGTAPFNMGIPALGISHVSFFKTVREVPEPAAALLLLGLGAAGLAALKRKS